MTDATAPKPRSSWRTSAKRTFTETVEAQPTLNSATLAGLYAACDLIDAADTMQRTVDTEGVIATGSQGQPVAHPLIAEVRHYRREAVALLRALGLTAQSPSSSTPPDSIGPRSLTGAGAFRRSNDPSRRRASPSPSGYPPTAGSNSR
jgi:P27 family predicted phage terminase small subunit